ISDVFFFQQGTMPSLDLATGRLLLDGPGSLFLSPNGHGGTLTALSDSGVLEDLTGRGVRHVFYFQVDNPLVRVGDPKFLGRHVERAAEVSSKIVRKQSPGEKVGILALVGGRCSIIEYSDLPADVAEERDPSGSLTFHAGSPAIHLFAVDFLTRITTGASGLPLHLAKKKVSYFDPVSKTAVNPDEENALKFERFIFDALPLADRWLAVEVEREDEFAPLKNATGPDSWATVHKAMTGQAAKWLDAAGLDAPPGTPLEVSPLYALDADQFAAKVDKNIVLFGPTYFR
ncbi:MAG TPA: UTP--glucose-1-phosphate uridylyltransferase, partial [Fimbriiglobus sp.]